MGRNIIGAFLGTFLGFIIVAISQMGKSTMYPLPKDISVHDTEGINNYMAQLPLTASLYTLSFQILGMIVGVWVAIKFSKQGGIYSGIFVAIILLIATMSYLVSFYHPIWLIPVSMICLLVFAWLTMRVAIR